MAEEFFKGVREKVDKSTQTLNAHLDCPAFRMASKGTSTITAGTILVILIASCAPTEGSVPVSNIDTRTIPNSQSVNELGTAVNIDITDPTQGLEEFTRTPTARPTQTATATPYIESEVPPTLEECRDHVITLDQVDNIIDSAFETLDPETFENSIITRTRSVTSNSTRPNLTTFHIENYSVIGCYYIHIGYHWYYLTLLPGELDDEHTILTQIHDSYIESHLEGVFPNGSYARESSFLDNYNALVNQTATSVDISTAYPNLGQSFSSDSLYYNLMQAYGVLRQSIGNFEGYGGLLTAGGWYGITETDPSEAYLNASYVILPAIGAYVEGTRAATATATEDLLLSHELVPPTLEECRENNTIEYDEFGPFAQQIFDASDNETAIFGTLAKIGDASATASHPNFVDLRLDDLQLVSCLYVNIEGLGSFPVVTYLVNHNGHNTSYSVLYVPSIEEHLDEVFPGDLGYAAEASFFDNYSTIASGEANNISITIMYSDIGQTFSTDSPYYLPMRIFNFLSNNTLYFTDIGRLFFNNIIPNVSETELSLMYQNEIPRVIFVATGAHINN